MPRPRISTCPRAPSSFPAIASISSAHRECGDHSAGNPQRHLAQFCFHFRSPENEGLWRSAAQCQSCRRELPAMKSTRLVFFALISFDCACESASGLPLGAAMVADTKMDVSAGVFGDDLVQLFAATECSDYAAFRNFPSWQFDSCETCFGEPIGAGILSSKSSICGTAFGPGWTSVGECGAELSVEVSSERELSGSIVISKSTGGSVEVVFRATRTILASAPPSSTNANVCSIVEGGGLESSVCCNWSVDANCAAASLAGTCRE